MLVDHTISLCNLELNLMVAVAKQNYMPVNKEDSTFDFKAIDIGLTLGNQNVALSATMLEALDNIRVLDKSVYDSFAYAYNGALSIGTY